VSYLKLNENPILQMSDGGMHPGMENIKKTFCLICGLMFTAAPQISPAMSDTLEVRGNESSYLARTIYKKLAGDRAASVKGLEVEEREGEIVLRGYVPDICTREFVERNIRNMIGVRKVVNLLQVTADSLPGSSGELELRVDSALSLNPYVEKSRMTMSVAQNEVTLAGTLKSEFERKQAEQAVQRVTGVKGVKNLIAIEGSSFQPGSSGLKLISGSQVAQAVIDSICLDTGMDPDLYISLKSSPVEYWKEPIYNDSARALVTAMKPIIRGNPEIGRYEQFNFLGLGVFLARKVLEMIGD